jgi:hypothetical protein
MDLERVLGRVGALVDGDLRQVCEQRQCVGTVPSGVSNALAAGTASPRSATRCAGPISTTRRT